jgi:hypothetical protein
MLQRLKFDLVDLSNEMLDQLPEHIFKSKTTTFYDPSIGGGQFVVEVENRLRQYGHSDENISKRVFGYVGNRIRLNYIMNTHKLVGTYKTTPIENMEFNVVLGNPPYQETLGASRGKSIWDKFVLKSYSLLKPKGYLSLIHPGSWRAPKGKFKYIQKIYKENNLIFLKLSDYKQGYETFGVGTNYDYFILQKSPNQGKTHLIDTEGNSEVIDISLLEFIPNSQLSLYNKIIAKPGEEKVQLLGNSSYHSARDYVSNTQNNEFKYPVIWSITQSKGINLKYSKINNKGHFNQPKVVFSHGGGTYPIIDDTGKFGLTEFGFGIVDSISNLKNIQKALENPLFISLMSSAGFRNLKYEPKVIETFRKDFWKEFIK